MRSRSFVPLAAGLVTSAAVAEPPRLEVGAPVPSIALPSIEDGELRSLEDFRGRKIVLHVFASW